MNDEASSSAAASGSRHHADAQYAAEAAPTAAEVKESRNKSRLLFNKKRGELLDDLLRNLDILIYAELSVIYYMDCSFLRFALRAFVQFLYLTPKAPILPEPPVNKPVLGPLVGSNLLCILLHIWLSAPSAGEATQGYLHGGLAMDFIGQQGPTSKIHLVVLDLLLVTLQLIMLPACLSRRKLREPAAAPTRTEGNPAPATTPARTNQDLDSEERGVRRSQEEEGIELQNLAPSTQREDATSTEPEAEREALLSPPPLRPANDIAILDTFNSGQIILADLNIFETIKDQVRLTTHPPPPSAEPARSEQRTLRAELAGRMLRMRLGGAAL